MVCLNRALALEILSFRNLNLTTNKRIAAGIFWPRILILLEMFICSIPECVGTLGHAAVEV